MTAANVHDSRMLAPLLDAVAPVRTGRRGRPRRRPDKLHADKGYDDRRCRGECVTRGVRHRIARRMIEPSDRLGRHRWVVERTIAWLARYRRLTIRTSGSSPCTAASSTSPAPSSAGTDSSGCKTSAEKPAKRAVTMRPVGRDVVAGEAVLVV